jgi:phage terminase small subunit
VSRIAERQVNFADWELVRQGLRLEPLLQAISDFLDTQKDMIEPLRKHRENPAEPVATGDWPETPAWLSKGAAGIFEETCATMAKLGTLSSEFSDAIAAYASAQDEVITLTAIIEDLGATYQTTTATGDVMFRRRHEVAMRSDEKGTVLACRARFGAGIYLEVGKTTSRRKSIHRS